MHPALFGGHVHTICKRDHRGYEGLESRLAILHGGTILEVI
jgi:hypothetical protein